jgi:hypothetical protein
MRNGPLLSWRFSLRRRLETPRSGSTWGLTSVKVKILKRSFTPCSKRMEVLRVNSGERGWWSRIRWYSQISMYKKADNNPTPPQTQTGASSPPTPRLTSPSTANNSKNTTKHPNQKSNNFSWLRDKGLRVLLKRIREKKIRRRNSLIKRKEKRGIIWNRFSAALSCKWSRKRRWGGEMIWRLLLKGGLQKLVNSSKTRSK